MKSSTISFSIVLALAGIGWVGAQDSELRFFLTSEGRGDGANLGGLAGADAHCQSLAAAVGAGDKTWRAYLSTTGGDAPINARDRIGVGPWTNANGVVVATDVDDLHTENNKLSKENSIGEGGQVHNGRGDAPNRHDILTGSDLNGNAFDDGEDHSCMDWTSNLSDGSAQVGHHDRSGGGANPTSWNNAHRSRGCGQADLQGTGGDGLYYCFATD